LQYIELNCSYYQTTITCLQ